MKRAREDRILCLCARPNLQTVQQAELLSLCRDPQIDWDYLFTTADFHQISPLVFFHLTRLPPHAAPIPARVFNRFKTAQIRNVLAKQRTRVSLAKALALLHRKGIDVMVVKGEALNHLVYDRPWYTISHDVDLVIRPKKDELSARDRDDITSSLDDDNWERDGFKEHIEYDFFAHHDITMNAILTVDWERIWAEAQPITILGYPVFVMTPEDLLLSAAINSCRKRFFRLKSICDVAAIIETYPGLDWSTVVAKSHAYRCNTILFTALAVTRETVGCQLPDGVLDTLKVNPVRRFVIDVLVKHLARNLSLSALFVQSGNATYERALSWPLLLTYATYRLDLLGPKLGELYDAWRNPPPPVPG